MKKSAVILYKDLCEEWIDILKEGNFDTLGLHFIPAVNTMEEYLAWLESEGRGWIDRIENMGIAVEHELHVLNYLLPRDLFADHPDYFRLSRDGTRKNDYNLCTASAGALAVVEENAYRLAKALGQRGHRYYFWLDDKPDAYCHCPVCEGRTGSDQSLEVLKYILAGLRRYDKEASVCYLAYLGSIEPPKEPLPEGMFLEFAPIKRDMLHPLTDEVNRGQAEVFSRLLSAFNTDCIEVLEYWMDVSFYCKWDRLPRERVPYDEALLRADFAHYIKGGATAIKTFAAFMDEDYFKKYGSREIRDYARVLAEFN